MASSAKTTTTREEKQRFFDELDRLGQSDDDSTASEGEGGIYIPTKSSIPEDVLLTQQSCKKRSPNNEIARRNGVDDSTLTTGKLIPKTVSITPANLDVRSISGSKSAFNRNSVPTKEDRIKNAKGQPSTKNKPASSSVEKSVPDLYSTPKLGSKQRPLMVDESETPRIAPSLRKSKLPPKTVSAPAAELTRQSETTKLLDPSKSNNAKHDSKPKTIRRKGKGKDEIPYVPEDQRIFEGFKFCRSSLSISEL